MPPQTRHDVDARPGLTAASSRRSAPTPVQARARRREHA